MTFSGLTPSQLAHLILVGESWGCAGRIAIEDSAVHNVLIAHAGPNKIQVIKAIRELTGLGLKEAKDIVEIAPHLVVSTSDKGIVETTRAMLEGAGATVQVTVSGEKS